ncbi:MAG: helix-turn-helix transcriptional regulator [Rhizomicrobium sp.]|jgi:transcriptional regulator with XRE-family HTH domain
MTMSEMELYRRLGRAVAVRREELGLTQQQVGAQLGLSRASVANIENGRQRIMIHQLFGLTNALKLDSVLELVPEKWVFDTPAADLKVTDGTLSPKQESGVQGFLVTAMAGDRRRKRTSR